MPRMPVCCSKFDARMVCKSQFRPCRTSSMANLSRSQFHMLHLTATAAALTLCSCLRHLCLVNQWRLDHSSIFLQRQDVPILQQVSRTAILLRDRRSDGILFV
jgi:hypothetical protein